MKANRLKQALKAGQIPVGHMIMEFATRGMAQILEVAGVDFAVIDMEHTGFSTADVSNLIAWFKATSVAPLVRIPQIERHFVARLMDAGALGIMVPDVKNARQMQAVVDVMKYPPLGQRGPAVGLAQTDFQQVNAQEFMALSNQNTTLIGQIESQEALDNLDEIAAIQGLDILWVGHNDLSQSLGIHGQFHHEKFVNAMRQVASAAQRYGLAMGAQPGSLEQAQEWVALGLNVVSYSSDVTVYGGAMSAAVRSLRAIKSVEV